MKNKIKRILKWLKYISITFLSVITIYCVIYSIINPSHHRYTDCGKIISRASEDVAIKRGSRTDLYLVIDFKKAGEFAVNVSANDYYTSKVGEYSCYNLMDYDKNTTIHFVKIIIGRFFSGVYIFVLIYLIVKGCGKLKNWLNS